jgi:hypothetical protein
MIKCVQIMELCRLVEIDVPNHICRQALVAIKVSFAKFDFLACLVLQVFGL